MIKQTILCVVIMVWGYQTMARADAESIYHFNTAEQAKQFADLTEELRCVVCQNQTIASSNASLAVDLRDIIYKKVLAGEENNAIKQFIVHRYGDFILYQPPFNRITFALWLCPIILLLIAIFFIRKIIFFKAKT